MHPSRRGATLIELVAILFAVMIVVALLLPALRPGLRTPGRAMENGTRIRGIHQGMVTFANSNKGHFPGLTGDPDNPFTHANDIKYWDKGGEAAGSYVGARYAIMIEGNFFDPNYAVCPFEPTDDVEELDLSESQPIIHEPTANLGQGIGPFNYSYALLEIHDTTAETPTPNGAAVEWRDTLNSQAMVAGDRNIGTDSAANIQSIHTTSPGEWEGNVVWNDNHVTFEQSPVMEVSKFGQNVYHRDGSTPIADHLFTNDDAGNDAKFNIKGGAGK